MERRQPSDCWRIAAGAAGAVLGLAGLFLVGGLMVEVKLAAVAATAATLILISAASGPEWLPGKDDYGPADPPRDAGYFLRVGRFWLIAFALVAGSALAGRWLDDDDRRLSQTICSQAVASNSPSPQDLRKGQAVCLLAARGQ